MIGISEEWSTCIGVVQVGVMDDDDLVDIGVVQVGMINGEDIGVVQIGVMDDDDLVDIGVVQVGILKVLDELDPSYTICGLKILGVTTLCCHSSIQ